MTGTILGDGTSHPENDFRVDLDDGSVFEADGKLVETYDPDTEKSQKTGLLSYNLCLEAQPSMEPFPNI